MRVLIVEDETTAFENLSQMLSIADPTLEIVGNTEGVQQTVRWLGSNPKPDLIFMDIHLSDSICFEIFNNVQISAPIIFTTAYNQYAIEAFKTNGIAYLLKPIDEEELAEALKKYDSLTKGSQDLAEIQQQIHQLSMQYAQTQGHSPYKERLLAKVGDNYQHITMNDVAYFYSEDHYTFVATKDKQRYIINYTLDTLIEQLDPKQFFRISRQFILNINSINTISKHFNGRLKLTVNPSISEDIYVSRNRVPAFLAWLDGEIVTIQ